MPKFQENDRDSIEVMLDILKALRQTDSSKYQKGEEPSLQHLKELRKMLAELQLDLRKLSKIEGWDRIKRLNCSLLQAKLKRLAIADVFVELEDIKRLAEIRSDVDDWLSTALKNDELRENPLSEMVMEARDLHSTIQKIRKEYEQILEKLADFGGAEWSNEHIQRQKREVQIHWDHFLATLQSEKNRLEKHFPNSPNGPEPELYALNQLMDARALGEVENFRQILFLTSKEGEFWKKAIKLYEDYNTRIDQLEKQFLKDEKCIQEALQLAKKGDYRQAGKLLEQTSRNFVDLPYDRVQTELHRWKELAIQPFQELANLFPASANLDQSRDAVLAFGSQFPSYVKEHVSDRLRGSLNPVGLFLTCRRWEKQVTAFIGKCNKALEKVESETSSDFREVISERWDAALDNAQLLLDEIRKRTMGYFIRKTVVVVLLGLTGFTGYQLFYFWHKLPETGLRFHDSGSYIKSISVLNPKGLVLKQWIGKEATHGEYLQLPPGQYHMQVNFKETLPMQLNIEVELGKVTDLSDRLKLEYSDSLSRVLEFRIPSGSEIKLTNQHLGQERIYRVTAETLPLGVKSCTWLDWDASTNRMAIAERTGQLQVVSTEDNVAALGTLYVQGESFEKVLLSKQQGNKYVAGVSMSGVVYVWEAESGKVFGQLKHDGKSVIATAFYNGSKSLLTLDSDYHLRLWELNTTRVLKSTALKNSAQINGNNWSFRKVHPAWQLSLPKGLKQSLDVKAQSAEIFIPQDSQNLVVGIQQTNGEVQIWAGNMPENLQKVDIGKQVLQTFAIHPSGNSMIAVNQDGELQEFNWDDNTETKNSTLEINLQSQEIIRLLFSPKGNVLLVVDATGIVESIPLTDKKEAKKLPILVTSRAALVSAPKADSIAYFSAKEEIQVWQKWITQHIFAPKGEYDLKILSPTGNLLMEDSISVLKGGLYRFDFQNDDPGKHIGSTHHIRNTPITKTGPISRAGGASAKRLPPRKSSNGISKTSGSSPTAEER